MRKSQTQDIVLFLEFLDLLFEGYSYLKSVYQKLKVQLYVRQKSHVLDLVRFIRSIVQN